jgi:hypothetical protein
MESLQYYKGCMRVTSCLDYFVFIVIKVIYITVIASNNLNCVIV